ncbi:hypothetical protein EEL30_21760 [Brevibacillus laterosporus]|uniref:Uncharacterized protein n=1 Tax=Brevibacillus laterosporus TaxID=1465 RepID=A0A518VCE6_BRELA|nr:hypothetical protein EEL30_21760 [Brevibacillus laterosporus]
MKFTSNHIAGVLEHKRQVGNELNKFSSELFKRGVSHDYSKFSDEEMLIFEQVTPNLKKLTYGSEEYKAQLKAIEPALNHHYANNSHHPEYHQNGIQDMNLMDIVEMLCDWMAAVKRHENGNIFKSININQERFGYSNELKSILLNTVRSLHKYCIEWSCCDGRKGGYVADNITDLHEQIDNDVTIEEDLKNDLKYGFFREFQNQDYITKSACWDNDFSIQWTINS